MCQAAGLPGAPHRVGPLSCLQRGAHTPPCCSHSLGTTGGPGTHLGAVDLSSGLGRARGAQTSGGAHGAACHRRAAPSGAKRDATTPSHLGTGSVPTAVPKELPRGHCCRKVAVQRVSPPGAPRFPKYFGSLSLSPCAHPLCRSRGSARRTPAASSQPAVGCS